jgi:P-type Ca2+ transporter type 2C
MSPSNRRLDNKLNIFEGAFRNPILLSITAAIIVGQFLIVTFGKDPVQVQKLSPVDWAFCVGIGFTVWPVAVLLRLIPDSCFAKLVPRRWRQTLVRGGEPEIEEEAEADGKSDKWNDMKDSGSGKKRKQKSRDDDEEGLEMPTLKTIRGGRVNSLHFTAEDWRDARNAARVVAMSRRGSLAPMRE